MSNIVGPNPVVYAAPDLVAYLTDRVEMGSGMGALTQEGMAPGYAGPGWYYWDASWGKVYGPYQSAGQARQALNNYVAALDTAGAFDPARQADPSLPSLRRKAVPSKSQKPTVSDVVSFRYRNHAGEEETRLVRPVRLWFGSTAWHPEAQWLLEGWDLERCATRDYALAGIMGAWVAVPDPRAWLAEREKSDGGAKS